MAQDLTSMPPILIAGLFRELSPHLLTLLRSLSPEQWHWPTCSSERTVKDIASHLLDGTLRRLSARRDGYRPPDAPARFDSDRELVNFLTQLNAQWTTATRRLSPQVLIDLLAWSDPQLCDLFESLDPHSPGIPVAWAGETESRCWFDVAREYTEKWHHTQQIFEASGRPSTITRRRLFHPCLDTFMRALPFTYRSVEAANDTLLTVVITGEAGGRWHLVRENGRWRQLSTPEGDLRSTVTMSQDTAWKLVTRRRSREQTEAAFPDIRIDGGRAMGAHVLDMVSVVA